MRRAIMDTPTCFRIHADIVTNESATAATATADTVSHVTTVGPRDFDARGTQGSDKGFRRTIGVGVGVGVGVGFSVSFSFRFWVWV